MVEDGPCQRFGGYDNLAARAYIHEDVIVENYEDIPSDLPSAGHADLPFEVRKWTAGDLS